LLPGWGQRYQGYRSRGYIMLGLTGASMVYAVVADRNFRDAREVYEGAPAGADFEVLYRDFQEQLQESEIFGHVRGSYICTDGCCFLSQRQGAVVAAFFLVAAVCYIAAE
jgi:hypothetical protein